MTCMLQIVMAFAGCPYASVRMRESVHSMAAAVQSVSKVRTKQQALAGHMHKQL